MKDKQSRSLSISTTTGPSEGTSEAGFNKSVHTQSIADNDQETVQLTEGFSHKTDGEDHLAVGQKSEVDEVCSFLPAHWKPLDVKGQGKRGPPKALELAATGEKPSLKYTYLGDDPKEFLEGHARLFFLKQSLKGELSKDYEEKLSRKAYKLSRNLCAAMFSTAPSPPGSRVKVDGGLDKQYRKFKSKCVTTFSDTYKVHKAKFDMLLSRKE